MVIHVSPLPLAAPDRASPVDPFSDAPLRTTRPDGAGVFSFAERVLRERNLYGALAFAETAESLALTARALNVGPEDRVAGVTSSGDVLISLLARGPEAVAGFDANPAQTALAHLKLHSIKTLDVDGYLSLMGVDDCDASHRLATFDRVSRALPSHTRALLIKKRGWIPGGILNRGMTHLIIRALVNTLRRLVDPDTMALFLGDRGTDGERRERLNALAHKGLTRHGLRPALAAFAPYLKWLFFPHRICRVSTRPDEMIADFFETFRPLFERGARANPVLCRSATGAVHEEWSRFLYDEAIFARVRRFSDRITLASGELTERLAALPPGWATKVYLSNVPDYLTPAQLDALVEALHRSARPGARVLYLSLTNEDRLGPRLGPELRAEEMAAVRAMDNVHLYPSIVVRTTEARP